MKILITGESGYIGKNLAQLYLNSGNDLFYYRRNTLTEDLLRWKPEVIYHCAAEIYKEEEMFGSNVELTYSLLQLAEEAGTKAFIYVGSSSEYGRKDHPISEIDYLHPTTMYEATKGCGSLLSLSSKVPVIVARPFSVYGKNEPLRRFIPLVYEAYKQNKILRVGPGVHDFIYVDDFVWGLTICAKYLLSGKTQKDIVNFGTGIQHTNKEVVDIFEEVVGQKLKIETVSDKKQYDSNHWVCNPNYAREYYGFKATVTLREGLERYIRYREETSSENS